MMSGMTIPYGGHVRHPFLFHRTAQMRIRARRRMFEYSKYQRKDMAAMADGTKCAHIQDGKQLPDLTAPIIISITGHRDIPKKIRGDVLKKMEDFLRDLRRSYKHTKIIVQSALAPGADQIAAQATINCRNDGNAGMVEFRAVMPCEDGTFRERSFGKGFEQYWDKYLELLEQSDDSITLPHMGNTLKGDWFKYQLLCHSAYLVSTSHILIGIWDGTNNKAAGGTAYTIESAHNGVDPALINSIDRLFMGNGTDGTGGRYGDAGLFLGDNRNKGDASYLNVREDSLIYHIPTYREKSDEITKERCSGDKGTYYLPRLMYSNVSDGESLSYRAYNEFGWNGTDKIPKEYDEIFSNIDRLNERIRAAQNRYSFEELHSLAIDKLFDMGPYKQYLSALEELGAEVKGDPLNDPKDKTRVTTRWRVQCKQYLGHLWRGHGFGLQQG